MPLTYLQASDESIVNSVKDWINSQVKPLYDAKAVGKTWASTLKVLAADPDDPSIEAIIPAIAISSPNDTKPPENIQLGGGLVMRHKQIFLCCYAAVDSSGKPNLQSMSYLKAYVDYAFATAATMPINDYTVSPVVSGVDYAYLVEQRFIPVRKTRIEDGVLAITRHRFDFTFTLKYSETVLNG